MMCRIDVLFPTRDTGVLIWIPRFRGYQSPRRFGRYHSPRGLRLIPFIFSSYRELFMFSTMLRSLRISASYLLTRWMDRQHIRNTPRQQPTIMPRINQRIPMTNHPQQTYPYSRTRYWRQVLPARAILQRSKEEQLYCLAR